MFSANEKRFLLDTFTRGEFSGTWRKLFDEITKHVVWCICKSLVGAQVDVASPFVYEIYILSYET
mgnify:FL=1